MERQGTRKRIFVGMSGGVDSSVSAALLQKAGHDVTGVFIKVWQPDWIECNWKEERIEAMRAAAHLDIPLCTLDLEKEYKKDVIDYMIEEYRNGRTPNPDVMCNRYVKFGAFWKWAKGKGTDYIATGHYAQNKNLKTGDRKWKLLTGVDANKDQSYFLWTLNQNDLPHILFPVGDKTKPEVRALANKFKLPNADKKDSQGLCFIGKIDVKEFLAHYLETEKGNVLNDKGETIGTHSGALFFTIGERHGFEIDNTHKTPHDQPYYVLNKDVEQNTITVSNRKDSHAYKASILIRIQNVNWVDGHVPEFKANSKFPILVRTRYREPLMKARIVSSDASKATIELESPHDVITPGQSLVIYRGNECLGGGIIE